MPDHDLEARLARLERGAAVWRLVAIAALLAFAVNACNEKSAKPADHLELVTGTAKLRLDADKLEITSPESTLRLDARGIKVVTTDEKRTLLAQPGNLEIFGCAKKTPECKPTRIAIGDGAVALTRMEGEAKLQPGRLDLEVEDRSIKADVTNDKDVWITARANGGKSTAHVWVNKNVATVGTSILPESGGAPEGASLGVDTKGANVRVQWQGAEKTLGLGK